MAVKLSRGGKGQSQFELGQNSDINVTPFVDVMLVLLIIFMVAAPLATISIKVDIPPAPINPPPPKYPPVVVNIQPNQKIFLGQKATDYDHLVADLSAALPVPNPREEEVMIRADRYVPYGEFMYAMNILQNGGFNKLGLIAEDMGAG